MKAPCRWLADYVDIEVSDDATARLAERLTLAGLEVEGIEKTGSLCNAVVGRVVSSDPLPKSDHLTLCVVDIGSEAVEIVCGASNVFDDALVPVVLPGGELPTGLKIERRKIRGTTSNGMICSKEELRLEDRSEGIWSFEPGLDLSVGTDLAALLEYDDTIFDIKVPSNRPDCASVYGVAREVAALLGCPLADLATDVEETLPPTADRIRIEIEDPADTPRYAARLMEGITIAPAPARMQHRLIKAGMRPLSNVVDATNYVMLELGHPLHPFDADLVEEPIVIRRAKPGETFRTLDGIDRRLTEDVLMIADERGGLALAGVMGGHRSEIRPETTRLLLEIASFTGYTIRKSSRAAGLRSEASQRFERRIDPESVSLAAERAAHVIQRLTGCRVHRGLSDAYPAPSEPRTLRLRPERASLVLGLDLDRATCLDVLRRLQIDAEPDGSEIVASIPHFRPDLEREVDLIEDVGRVYGYDRLEAAAPTPILLIGRKDPAERTKDRIREILTGLGMIEVIGDGFDKRGWREALGIQNDDLVRVLNPMTVAQSMLRSNLLPGILSIVETNLSRGVDGGMIYEVGRVFSVSDGERDALGGALFGRTGIPLRGKERVSLPIAQGILGDLFKRLRLDGVAFDIERLPPYLRPGRGARFVRQGHPIGFLGELAPALTERFAVPTTVLVFEFTAADLTINVDAPIAYAELPQFPASRRDLSVSAPAGLPEAAVREVILAEAGVETVLLYDLYTGEQVGEGRKSLTYELAFRAGDRTLTDPEVDGIVSRIESLLGKLDVHLRT
jgi:phenylalanyl-tRNA synthetase beta chain